MSGTIPTDPFAGVDVARLRRARSSKRSNFDADVCLRGLPTWTLIHSRRCRTLRPRELRRITGHVDEILERLCDFSDRQRA